MPEKPTITLPLETAELIQRAFLPRNPGKLRLPHVDEQQRRAIRAACSDFHDVLQAARRAHDRATAEALEQMHIERLKRASKQ